MISFQFGSFPSHSDAKFMSRLSVIQRHADITAKLLNTDGHVFLLFFYETLHAPKGACGIRIVEK